ncbi:ISL3 family transposase [Megasphaera cerevisiae]|uniref:ISL3 family transposase n=2 Tax=Megasphaera cerevisiae TaxID=39029 RepID=UPI00191C3428|nr:ISL3 family transposase [Megasphaera cerevisiae]
MEKAAFVGCLKKTPQINKKALVHACIDDFAFKKRYTYGTILIDMDTHRVVDLLNSREKDDVSQWLRQYPNISVVSRDGSATYSAAITQAHPNAIQVSDRFHLFKNLSEAVEKYMYRLYPARLEIPATMATQSPEMQALLNTRNRHERIMFSRAKYADGYTQSEIALLLHSSISTISKYLKMEECDIPTAMNSAREKQHLIEMKKKQSKVDHVKELFKQGRPVEEIMCMTGHTYQTIMKYVSGNYSLINGHYDNRRPGKLQKYEAEVIELRSKGMTYKQITEIIRKKGYTGTVDALRVFMQKEREHQKNLQGSKPNTSCEYVARKWMVQLIYRKIEAIKGITNEQYEVIIKKYPTLGKVYELLRAFHELVFSKKVDLLDSWMLQAEKLDIVEINYYVSGLKNDISAVKNAIILQFNNGLAEGSVNKLKVIKRIMYGRCSFKLLKFKLLRLELQKIN